MTTEMPKCVECGNTLTPDEIKYYGVTCDACEGKAYHEQEEGIVTIQHSLPNAVYLDRWPTRKDGGIWFETKVNHPAMPKNKYISEASHKAALAEQEAKHREEMLGLLDEVDGIIYGLHDEGDLGHALHELDLIKQRIGES